MNSMSLEKFTDYLLDAMNLQTHWDWILQVFIVVLLSLLVSLVVSRTLNRLYDKASKNSENIWDDAIFHALRKPVKVLIWIVGIGYAAEIIHSEADAAIFSGVSALRDVGVIGCITWFLMRLIQFVDENIVEKHRKKGKSIDQTTRDAVVNILKVAVVITAALASLQTLGFSISGILAFGGVGGIAIGFAAKDLLANFFGAMIIFMDRPFKVGDWIRSPDQEIEGTVEKIGWRQTIIRTFDKRPLYVPNSLFANIVVENPSRMLHRRIYETIGVRYADMKKAKAIVDDVRQMLIDHPEIDEGQTMIVHINKFNASSVDFFIYTFTHTTEWVKFHSIKEDVLLKISDIIDSHEAEIAFPTQTLHVAELPELRTAEAGAPKGKAKKSP